MTSIQNEILWHPFTPLRDKVVAPCIVRAAGSTLFSADGKEYLDAISSWWVNLHGHANPHIAERIAEQARRLEHVIFASFTHEPAIELAARLNKRMPQGHERIFLVDNGSTAVEAALKLILQYWHQRGQRRTRILALRNSYHGDTFGAMSFGDQGLFRAPFDPFLFSVEFIDIPSIHDPQNQAAPQNFEELFQSNDVAALIYEPLLQGVGGMRILAKKPLEALLSACRNASVPTIADEVLTGFGRTGSFLAGDQLAHIPEIVCLAKGLTGGFLPLGALSIHGSIARDFENSDRARAFLHGHSYAGNPLGCAAAVASLELFDRSDPWDGMMRLAAWSERAAALVATLPGVHHASSIGTILRFEVGPEDSKPSYVHNLRDALYSEFLSRGALIRPLGNVLYTMPPYCTSDRELDQLCETLLRVIGDFGERLVKEG